MAIGAVNGSSVQNLSAPPPAQAQRAAETDNSQNAAEIRKQDNEQQEANRRQQDNEQQEGELGSLINVVA